MRIKVETVIAAPIETVFALMTDLARWPDAISAIDRIDVLTDGPVAAGTRFRETRRMFGREATEEMTVAELSPPTRFVLTAFNHGTAYHAEHVLAATEGGTRLTLIFDGTPKTMMARLMLPLGLLMRGTVTKQLAADLADIKRAAEAHAGQRT